MASSSSSSDFQSGEIRVPPKQRKGPPYIMLVPLIYAPALPLIRIGFRHNPILRDRLFYGVLAGAFAHGTYLISEIYDIESPFLICILLLGIVTLLYLSYWLLPGNGIGPYQFRAD